MFVARPLSAAVQPKILGSGPGQLFNYSKIFAEANQLRPSHDRPQAAVRKWEFQKYQTTEASNRIDLN